MAHVMDHSSIERFATAKKERKSVTIPKRLAKQAKIVIQDHEMSSLSELVTIALAEYIDKLEKAKFEKEMIEGYQANKEYYEKMSGEWKFADSE